MLSTAPVGLLLPGAANSTSLRKCKEECFFTWRAWFLTTVPLLCPLQASFKFPVCISRKLYLAAALAHTDMCSDKKRANQPFPKGQETLAVSQRW